MDKQKFVVSVGAGKNQLPLIKRLVERGYNVISFDKNINAPGKHLSYIFNNISTWDYNNSVQWIDSLKLNVEGVLCFSYGKALVTQQKIIEHFNLNCKLNKNVVDIMEDKKLQREILKSLNLSKLKEYYNYKDFVENQPIEYIVIKDRLGFSSNNVYLLNVKRCKNKIIELMSNRNYIIQ